jgi:hypothetical protein
LQESDINFDVKETNMDNNEFYKENGSFDLKDKGILNLKFKSSAKNRISIIEADKSAAKNNIGGINNFKNISKP